MKTFKQLLEQIEPVDNVAKFLHKHKKNLNPSVYKKHHKMMMSNDDAQIKKALDFLIKYDKESSK